MQRSNQILAMVLPGESPLEAKVRIEKDLASLPSLRDKWCQIKEMSHDSFEFIEELRLFFSDFQNLWELSSPKTMECFGSHDCYAIFELASAWKESLWSIDSLAIYNILPDQVVIYRGAAGATCDVLKGYSWTLNDGFAQAFAKNSNGIVVSAKIARSDILFVGDTELEVLPRRGALTDIHQVGEN